ncbi:MAG: CDP-alcohol phosphatidyltransferase family protein [Candidatus Puniceispirillaceae bacterium]
MTKRNRIQVSTSWMIPNIITIAALVSGLTALRFALDGQWQTVVGLIVLAGIFDALDGRTARLLRVTSAFGAALDSLSDVVVFGVIPGLCLYLWALQDQGNIAWAAALFYIICIALRLARFDSEIPDKPEYAKDFFTGLPSPAAGLLVLTPIVIDIHLGISFIREAWLVSAVLVTCGIGAVCTLPTFTGKTIKFPSRLALPFLAIVAMLVASAVSQPWAAYLLISAIYLLTIPLSTAAYLRRKAKFLAQK